MAYMCMGCYEVYDRELGYCPKVNCHRDVVEIDELMLLAIKILNQKGYITEYCCAGHVYAAGPQHQDDGRDDPAAPAAGHPAVRQ